MQLIAVRYPHSCSSRCSGHICQEGLDYVRHLVGTRQIDSMAGTFHFAKLLTGRKTIRELPAMLDLDRDVVSPVNHHRGARQALELRCNVISTDQRIQRITHASRPMARHFVIHGSGSTSGPSSTFSSMPCTLTEPLSAHSALRARKLSMVWSSSIPDRVASSTSADTRFGANNAARMERKPPCESPARVALSISSADSSDSTSCA